MLDPHHPQQPPPNSGGAPRDPYAAYRQHPWAPQPRPEDKAGVPWQRLLTAFIVLLLVMFVGAIGLAITVWLFQFVSELLEQIRVHQVSDIGTIVLVGMLLIAALGLARLILRR